MRISKSFVVALAVLGRALPAGAAGAAFLDISPSARSSALGGADVVASLGAESLGANPANLGLMTGRYQVFSTYMGSPGESRYMHAAAAFALKGSVVPLDGFGVSVTRLDIGGLETADASGRRTGSSFGSGDLAVGVGASGTVSPALRVGVTLKALRSTIAGYSSNVALAGDLGARYRAPRFALVASVNNLGQGVRFISQTDSLPTSLNLGAEVPLGPVVGVVTARRPLQGAGVEVGAGAGLSLGAASFSAGYLKQAGAGSAPGGGSPLAGLFAGVGIETGGVRFDYAFSPSGADLGQSHKMSMSVGWGGPARAGRF